MGHTITAWSANPVKAMLATPKTLETLALHPEIDTLRIEGKARRKTLFYEALGVERHNRKDSGDGAVCVILPQVIQQAVNHPGLTHEERGFLLLCLTFSNGCIFQFA